MTQAYENFDIRIVPQGDGRYLLTATMPYGEAEAAATQTLPDQEDFHDPIEFQHGLGGGLHVGFIAPYLNYAA